MTQILTATAKRMKAIRDKRYAMTKDRKDKKAHNQRWHRAHPEADSMDYDHKDGKAKSVHANRGNDGKGTKNEG